MGSGIYGLAASGSVTDEMGEKNITGNQFASGKYSISIPTVCVRFPLHEGSRSSEEDFFGSEVDDAKRFAGDRTNSSKTRPPNQQSHLYILPNPNFQATRSS